ncbi:MAG: NAD(+) synthase [Thermoplasmata archaeon]|nr:NAD(+) synthase [Thermoplasmata archaeon]
MALLHSRRGLVDALELQSNSACLPAPSVAFAPCWRNRWFLPLSEELLVPPIIGGNSVSVKSGRSMGSANMADANLQSRLRMLFLYYLANSNNLLVLGTGNKTELLVGYFTKYGDGASDLLPIGDLYKTQVWEMARDIGVPQEILDKTPSAGLPDVGSDEEELGYKYEELDAVLWGIEHGWDDARASGEAEVSEDGVKGIRLLVRKSAHKRGLGLIPKIGLRTVGIDWLEDRSW